MLSKIVAFTLVILVVSPFTAPFSTCKLAERRVSLGQGPYGSTDRASFVNGTTTATDSPTNFPVNVRASVRLQNLVRLVPADRPGAHGIASIQLEHRGPDGPDPRRHSTSVRRVTVLRL
jgi:hypothetical protein